jgi:hypothetical protein
LQRASVLSDASGVGDGKPQAVARGSFPSKERGEEEGIDRKTEKGFREEAMCLRGYLKIVLA